MFVKPAQMGWLTAVLLAASLLAVEAVPPPPDVAAPPEAAERSRTGLASLVLEPGTGELHPSPRALVTVHYTGWTTDGAMFDSSIGRSQPSILPLDRVIAGWTEGLQLMVVGEKRRFWIPENLAYAGKRDRPPGMLVFDVELIDFIEPPPPPPVPVDVAAPPQEASVTGSGLASKVIEAGTGTRHPTKKSTVTVHYSGWTTDGKMFDSSLVRGKPATFQLNRVIKGWTEGLQLMVTGETRRFWIPQKLAYKGQEGAPKGMLVFDVTLLEFD